MLCWPWDIDMFLEMNNGRVFTLFDLGRFDLAVRTGLVKTLKANKWGLVVAGSTVQYRKRIRCFNKITIRSKLVGIDEKWIYVGQTMSIKGEVANSAILRTAVTSGGKLVATNEVLKSMNLNQADATEHSPWLDQWISVESNRDFPDM